MRKRDGKERWERKEGKKDEKERWEMAAPQSQRHRQTEKQKQKQGQPRLLVLVLVPGCYLVSRVYPGTGYGHWLSACCLLRVAC
jgi:hypothetical protein